MKKVNLANVQEAGSTKKLPAGGYICRYTSVKDVAEKEYLYMEFDIAEGEYKNYYSSLYDRAGFWGGRCYRSYKDSAMPMFKRMCTAVGRSNKGFSFQYDPSTGKEVANVDEKTLAGKLIGIVLGEEEYEGNDGTIKTRLYVAYECSVDTIRKNEYKVPAFKELDNKPTQEANNDFIAFNAESSGVPW